MPRAIQAEAPRRNSGIGRRRERVYRAVPEGRCPHRVYRTTPGHTFGTERTRSLPLLPGDGPARTILMSPSSSSLPDAHVCCHCRAHCIDGRLYAHRLTREPLAYRRRDARLHGGYAADRAVEPHEVCRAWKCRSIAAFRFSGSFENALVNLVSRLDRRSELPAWEAHGTTRRCSTSGVFARSRTRTKRRCAPAASILL